MFLFLQQDDETKPSVVKKEDPDAAKPKQEPMEAEPGIKPEVKAEPKEEEEGGANSTSTSHKKSKTNNFFFVLLMHQFYLKIHSVEAL